MVPTSKAGTWIRNKVGEGAARRAFTLLELVVVLMVVGICATVVFPKVGGFLLREPEPRRSARLLARAARQARELAVATESTFVLSLEAGTGNYRIAQKQQDLPAASAAPSSWRGRLGEEVRITNVELTEEEWDPMGPVTLEFSPEGTSDPARITLTAGDGRSVSVVMDEWSDEIELVGEDMME